MFLVNYYYNVYLQSVRHGVRSSWFPVWVKTGSFSSSWGFSWHWSAGPWTTLLPSASKVRERKEWKEKKGQFSAWRGSVKLQMVSFNQSSIVFFSTGYRHHVYFGMEGTLMPERIGANSLTSFFYKRMSLFTRTGVWRFSQLTKRHRIVLAHIKGSFLALQH